jgi:hypothetical protein
MDINGFFKTYGIANISHAIIRDVNGDRHTGSRSSWMPASDLTLEPSEGTIMIVRELPDMIFLDAEGGVWKVINI